MGLSRWSAAGGDRMNHENSPFFLTQNKKTVYVYTEVELEEKEKEKNALTICRGGWKWHYTPWLFFFPFPQYVLTIQHLKSVGFSIEIKIHKKPPNFVSVQEWKVRPRFQSKSPIENKK